MRKALRLFYVGFSLLLLPAYSAMASFITVANPSFELPIFADGGFTPPGGTIPSWTITGRSGVFNPVVGTSVNSVPDGEQVGAAGNTVVSGDLFQDVGVASIINQLYQLQVQVGSRLEGTSSPLYPSDFTVQLLDGANVIGSTNGSLASGTGDFSLISVTGLGIGSGNLGIRLAEVSGGQTLFDAVTLETVVPIPAAVWLFGSGLLGLIVIARRKKA